MESQSLASSLTEEGRSFLQGRVATFGFVMAVVNAFGLIMRLVLAAASGSFEALIVHPVFLYQVLATAFFTGTWLVCRRGRHSREFVRRAEEVGLLGAVAATVLMGTEIPVEARPDMILLPLLTLAFFARCIWVPSTGRRTLLLGLIIGAVFVAAVYAAYRDVDPGVHDWATDQWTAWSEDQLGWGFAVGGAIWWSGTLFLCCATSAVIYGLRKEVSKARKLGQYTLERMLGEGAMGQVHRARHAFLRRPTAVKLLHPDRVAPRDLARFEREVQLTADLTHPNTITVFDYGRTPDGTFYYAMELLDGATLDMLVEAAGPLPPARAMRFLRQLAGALGEAHSIGLIHRDVKPANVIVTTQGGEHDVAKLLDFGLVRDLSGSTGETLSEAGHISGTPLYLSPEAIRSPDTIDARSDLYALGALGYFLLTGAPPFVGETIVDVCVQHVNETPKPLREAHPGGGAPEALERLVLDCLAKDPGDRPQTAADVIERLDAVEMIGAWTERDAKRWWQSNGDALRAGQQGGGPTHTAGLTLDVART
ncbi:MAG: serine/threonine-protein kinase [Planctomycetota bacterium]|nr:serine/threonine-protein kinase [Planctomycetota bacterium]